MSLFEAGKPTISLLYIYTIPQSGLIVKHFQSTQNSVQSTHMALKHFVVFTLSGEGASIALKLQDEGRDVILAMLPNEESALTDKELESRTAPDKKGKEQEKRRLTLYDGMVNKMNADDVVDMLKEVPSPEEYFLFFDFNHCFRYAEQLSGLGFNGNFPTEEDRLLEVEREEAKSFVEKHYTHLETPEHHEFDTIEEATDFLAENDDIFVLKPFNDAAKTVVPTSTVPEMAHQELIAALENDKNGYEKDHFILEKKIIDVIELTPEMNFYNGKPLFALMDIEEKRLEAGEQGMMTGCAQDLVFPINMGSKICRAAFPPAVYDMAKKHEGWFVWDASILIDKKDGTMYFGEFCPNRKGYNAFYTELSMLPSASKYFESLVAGKNPFPILPLRIDGQFGASARMFNLKYDDKGLTSDDTPIISMDEKNVWLLDAKLDDEQLCTAGYTWDIATVTGNGKTPENAAFNLYENIKQVNFNSSYKRPLFDYTSLDYPNSILNRYNYGKQRKLF